MARRTAYSAFIGLGNAFAAAGNKNNKSIAGFPPRPVDDLLYDVFQIGRSLVRTLLLERIPRIHCPARTGHCLSARRPSEWRIGKSSRAVNGLTAECQRCGTIACLIAGK